MRKWSVQMADLVVIIVADEARVDEDGTLVFWRAMASNRGECLLKAFKHWDEVTLVEE